MKKIALLISMIALSSCMKEQTPIPVQSKINNNPSTHINHMNITEFGYNNHDYIMFTYYMRPDISGVVHSPDCHCRKVE
jgi:nitrous oxide reductase accessory protein NosL